MKKSKKDLMPEELIRSLASSSPNDAVKLLFLGEEDTAVLDSLDLSLISEIKRSSNGAVELKFVNRLDVIRFLAELRQAESSADTAGASFYTALDKAAKALDGEDK
mgnify:CR=1 FL=1